MSAPLRIIVDRSRLRRWQVELANRVSPQPASFNIEIVDGPALPTAIETLFSIERLIFGLAGPRLSDHVERSRQPTPAADERVLDFTGSTSRPGSLRVLFDGLCDEAAIFGALFEGRAPLVQILEGDGGRILGQARPSIETARCLTEAYESVVACTTTLIRKVLSGDRLPQTISAGALLPSDARAGGIGQATRYALRALTRMAVRWLYNLCTHSPHWRVGWRFVDGPGVLERGNLLGPEFRNIPDPGTRFFADPFPLVWRGETWLFFEDFDHRVGKGVISAMPFDANGPAGPARVVLETPWHLSYPFLMEDEGELWMIPESSVDRTVRLYRAERFPDRWVEEAILIEGVSISDATIHVRDGRYWMFGTLQDGAGAPSDTMCLFHADRLRGPWLPHAANPVLIDAATARPAGRIEVRNGRLLRPVQDCSTGYGRALHIAEITKLTPELYAQEVRFTLRPGPQWPGRRLHTLNRSGRLECIDGSAISPRTFALPWSSTPEPHPVERPGQLLASPSGRQECGPGVS